jgi:hypothetical protein
MYYIFNLKFNRQIKSATTSTIPGASALFNIMIPLSSAYYSTYFLEFFNVKENLYKYTIDVWKYGILGYQHAGKCYFLLCSVISLFLTWYYSLFVPKSFSGSAIVLLIRGIAAFIIFESSSNIEFIVLSFAIVYFWPLIEFSMHRIHLSYSAAASKPTSYYTGVKLSNAEYEAQGRAC